MRAPGHCALHLAPRLGVAIGAWGASAQSARASGPDEPFILGVCAQHVGAAAAAADATLAAGRADHERDRLARAAPFKLRQARAPRRSCGCGSAVGDLRALRDDQRVKDAEVAAKEAHQVANAQGRAFCKHAGAGAVDVALPLLYAARLPAGCGPDTARAVAGWGRGRMQTLLGRWQVGADAECCGCCFGRLQVWAEAAQKHRHATV